jgi:hypothetical protein
MIVATTPWRSMRSSGLRIEPDRHNEGDRPLFASL